MVLRNTTSISWKKRPTEMAEFGGFPPSSRRATTRAPLPRFTALDAEPARERARQFFVDWSKLSSPCTAPGGVHVFIATNASSSAASLRCPQSTGASEFRGQLIRLVRTLVGGDRPKNAEAEFPGVASMPKGCYEPWGIFRKPLPPKMTVSECSRRWQTGGLRRTEGDRPFEDLIPSERTRAGNARIANHPSIKPQSFPRRVVHAPLPLGKGIIVDPFMGSGSTIAAVEAIGLSGIGVERFLEEYYDMAQTAIPRLQSLEAAQSRPRDRHSTGPKEFFLIRPVNPIGFHFVEAAASNACSDRPAASGRAARRTSNLLRSAALTTFTNRKGRGSIPELPLPREALESKQNTISQTSSGLCPCQPFVCQEAFTSIPRVRARSNRRVLARWQNVGMAIVVLVTNDTFAVFGNRSSHELADHAAEVGRHEWKDSSCSICFVLNWALTKPRKSIKSCMARRT